MARQLNVNVCSCSWGPYTQVVNCSSTVLAISAQYTVLAAQASTTLSFDIFLTSSQANQALSCVVSLVNTEVPPRHHASTSHPFHMVPLQVLGCKCERVDIRQLL